MDRVRNGDTVVIRGEQRQRTVGSFWGRRSNMHVSRRAPGVATKSSGWCTLAPLVGSVAASKVGPFDVRACGRRLQTQSPANATIDVTSQKAAPEPLADALLRQVPGQNAHLGLTPRETARCNPWWHR